MEPTTSSWTDSACPSWCARAHRLNDHPEDRRHQGPAQLVTLSIGSTPPTDTKDAMSVDIVIHADRPDGSAGEWLRIESTESTDVRLALTAPATRELIRALHIVLEQISR
ncbi:DUF6907 domain-containing protein [Nocardioides sp.]|uniref:DUF6907 domain-containing protein n=1 Tax=Nocardioides sp. TaxID=35761 RepID=UPI002CB51812|nr:hypothetical protein [Nocardioides sp.]HSX66973.1 hypothetical protein [Nocardioides sp.]